ncbi:hypothetical protein KJ665_02205 [Patescibacteria group bacterium]|nr:hypothetical protein [Patescibacteria group bacterium]
MELYRKMVKSVKQHASKQVALVIGGHGILRFTFLISTLKTLGYWQQTQQQV